MRPRGESISRCSSRYVGHALRQRPQWTHLSRSRCWGLSKAAMSEAAIEPSAIQQAGGIEHGLHLLHHGKVASGRGPKFVALAEGMRREVDQAAALGVANVAKKTVAD